MLDRLTQLVPGWRERSAADLGVTLVELLAYVGDHLSYWQDAVATEAYLETARLRTSLRRHALLVDYHVHDGCNARVWLHVEVNAGGVALPKVGTRFYSRVPAAPRRITPGSRDDVAALPRAPDGVRAAARLDAARRAQRDQLLHLGRPSLLPARGRHGGDARGPPRGAHRGRRAAVRGGHGSRSPRRRATPIPGTVTWCA